MTSYRSTRSHVLMRWLMLAAITFVALLLDATMNAHASTPRELSWDDDALGQTTMPIFSSDVIALGTVLGRRTRLSAPTDSYPLGYSRLHISMSVEASPKGSPGDTLNFLAGYARSDSPFFSTGERALVFLNWCDAVLVDPSSGRSLCAMSSRSKLAVAQDGMVCSTGEPAERVLATIRQLLQERDPKSLMARADLVVIGDLTSRQLDGRREVLPPEKRNVFVTVDVRECIKGEAPGDTLVVVPPPQSDEYTPMYPGETALLFLSPILEGREFFELVGGHDGKYRMGDFTTTDALESIGYTGQAARQPISADGPPPN